jgi:hypothetical protein
VLKEQRLPFGQQKILFLLLFLEHPEQEMIVFLMELLEQDLQLLQV